jgi:hypothetical protein
MPLIFRRECDDLAVGDDPSTPPAKDELASVEMAQREDTLAFCSSVPDLDIGNHDLIPAL